MDLHLRAAPVLQHRCQRDAELLTGQSLQRWETPQFVAEPNGSGGYVVPPSAGSTLVQNSDGTYALTLHATQILTFRQRGELLALSDLNGYTTTLSYNGSNQLTTITDAAGRTITLNYGANALVSAVTDPLGRTTAYSYDGSDELTSVSDPLGRVWSFTYDGSHRMLTMTDPNGRRRDQRLRLRRDE